MSRLKSIGWRRGVLGLLVAAMMVFGAMRFFADAPEIALIPGEPWEDMRQRSSAGIGPAIPGHYWGTLPDSDARLRLVDPQYGFVTPLAREFTVSFDNERVGNVRMSPQIEPLLLDDTIRVIQDLQGQWRKGGWVPVRLDIAPEFEDTPQWRAALRNEYKGGKFYWEAGSQYKVMLVVSRFEDDRNPSEERYLITLELAKQRPKL